MPVMELADLHGRYLERFGVQIVVPDDGDRLIVDRIIFDELVVGPVLLRSRTENSATPRSGSTCAL